MKIEVGDYVEPASEKFVNFEDHDDFVFEDLFGFVTEKSKNMITIQSIGRDIESIWEEKYFVKAEVPEFFKKNKIVRIRKSN